MPEQNLAEQNAAEQHVAQNAAERRLRGQGVDTPETVVAAVDALGPVISARAGEVEANRRLPGDLLGALVRAGCFRLLLPHSHGGGGADLSTGLRLFEALARADGSVGWTVMIGASSWIDLAGLPRATFDALLAAPEVIVAGAFNPTGSITAVDRGYRVSGRWGFASGCEHAHWLYGNCLEKIAGGDPRLRMAVFAADQVVIEDTWSVSGLRGTGSHHFHVTDLVVPAERTCLPLADEPCLDEPIVRIPPPALYALAIAGVAVGIGQGALDDIRTVAARKVPLLAGARLAASPLFQFDFASADTGLRAAQALLHDAAASAWATAAGSGEFGWEQRARLRATAVWVTRQAVDAVTVAYRAGGGGALYTDSPLQRRLRDVHALAQHFLVRPDTLTTAGAILAGEKIRPPVF